MTDSCRCSAVRESVTTLGDAPLNRLTALHWLVSSVPLALTIIAVVLTTRRFDNDGFGDGLALSLIVSAGASIHQAVWPAGYGDAVTSTNIQRLVSVAILAGLGVHHLQRLARNGADVQAVPIPSSTDRNLVLPHSSDLGAVVAHELGSSIAAVRGFVDILSLPDLDATVRQQTLDGLRGEAVMLGVLAGDIQTLGAAQHHRLTVTPFPIDLGVLIGDAVGFARSLPGDHVYQWRESLSIKVMADPERISQVFRNLLTNAAKYTPPHLPIEIAVRRSGLTVRVSVIDHGPGLPPTDETRVFGMFDRGESPSLAIPGTGIGLYISRELVRLHGHDLAYEPTPGGGATFTFELDIAP